jgi:hypothetical protein
MVKKKGVCVKKQRFFAKALRGERYETAKRTNVFVRSVQKIASERDFDGRTGLKRNAFGRIRRNSQGFAKRFLQGTNFV